MSSNTKYVFPAEYVAKLGKVPDRVIAEALGITTHTVYEKRTAEKIPPCGKHDRTNNTKLSTEAFGTLVAALGTRRDSILARGSGVSREYVRQLRLKYQIKKFSTQTES